MVERAPGRYKEKPQDWQRERFKMICTWKQRKFGLDEALFWFLLFSLFQKIHNKKKNFKDRNKATRACFVVCFQNCLGSCGCLTRCYHCLYGPAKLRVCFFITAIVIILYYSSYLAFKLGGISSCRKLSLMHTLLSMTSGITCLEQLYGTRRFGKGKGTLGRI